jgi:phosphatidylglycerophosphatase A
MRTRQSSPDTESMSTPGIKRAFRLHPVATLLASGFGSGFSPVVPGTAGSAVALLLAWLLARFLEPSHAPSVAAGVGLLVSGLAIGAVGIPLSTRVARALGAKDPGCVVIDEFAGQFLAASPVPFFRFASPSAAAAAWIVSFFLFRLFDVWKPGPVERLQDLPEGLGIVVDDILAGLLAAGATVVAAVFLSRQPWF